MAWTVCAWSKLCLCLRPRKMGCLELRSWWEPLSSPHSILTIRGGGTQKTTQQVFLLSQAPRGPGCWGAPVSILGRQKKKKHHKLCCMASKMYSLPALETKSLKSRYQQGCTIWSFGGGHCLSLLALRTPGVPGLVAASLPFPPLSSHGLLFYVCVSVLLIFIRTSMIGFRDHLDNSEWSIAIDILKLITSS